MELEADFARVWEFPDCVRRIASFLEPNEAACLRPVNRATACSIHAVIILSQPAPRWAFQQHWALPESCRALSYRQRLNLVTLTACSDVVENLEQALAATGIEPCKPILLAAASSGALASCRYLAERLRVTVDWDSLARAASEKGLGAVLAWALERCPASARASAMWAAAEGAARSGNALAMEQWMAESKATARRFRREFRAACAAAAAAKAAAKTAAVGGAKEGGQKAAETRAAAEANGAEQSPEDDAEDDEEELLDQYGPRGRTLVLEALAACSLGVVQRLCASPVAGPRGLQGWIRSHLKEALCTALYGSTPDWAAKAALILGADAEADFSECYASEHLGRCGGALLERYEWLKSHGFPPTQANEPGWALLAAMEYGSLDAVRWLLAEGVVPDEDVVFEVSRAAAVRGDVGALEHLKQAGWALDPAALLQHAASAGQVPVMDWLWASFLGHEDLGPKHSLLDCACGSGSVAAMGWALEGRADPRPADGQPGTERSGSIAVQGLYEGSWAAVASSGCEAAAELLAEVGCPMPTDGAPYRSVADSSHQPWWMFPTLRRLGVPLGPADRRLLAWAVERRAPLVTLRWLLAEGCPVSDWADVEAAVWRRWHGTDKEEVLAWVQEQRALRR
ncbi:hypothetical protein HYH03_013716 [Edaphochlamys debaryana]|uniref:Uncharacterized protein n=1 Tax=Edaphochlamys debaryana TaxID=47281 RepID=A0A835XQI7_9CHLO|nr:hypothetical protein HYH03_013716 [Edaphochlamys debaryana]|eukprot:KAG2487717.1 hypothetical protein HYH03_013716 [Edaphochlamys debaryana]